MIRSDRLRLARLVRHVRAKVAGNGYSFSWPSRLPDSTADVERAAVDAVYDPARHERWEGIWDEKNNWRAIAIVRKWPARCELVVPALTPDGCGVIFTFADGLTVALPGANLRRTTQYPRGTVVADLVNGPPSPPPLARLVVHVGDRRGHCVFATGIGGGFEDDPHWVRPRLPRLTKGKK